MIGKPIYGNGFRGCLSYLSRGREGKNPERVEWCSTRNLGGLAANDDHRQIGRTMRATANLSSRTKKPVLHLPISWTKGDASKLDRETMEQVADKVLTELGLEEHQAAIYAHNDTGHKHVHIIVNRVHPETGKAWSTSRDWQRINKVLAREEHALGLEVVDHWGVDMERDLERVKERLQVEDFTDWPRPTDGEQKQAEREQRLPDKPFSKEQTKDLRETIGVDFEEASSWKELEARLAAKGFTLMPKGQGAVITDGRQVAKLSQMGRGIRLKGLEEQFGQSYRDWSHARAHELADEQGRKVKQALPEKPDFGKMPANERRAAERVWKGQMDAARERAERGQFTGDAAYDLDLADTDARYWMQVDRTYRETEKQHAYARRRLSYHEGREGKAVDWLAKRESDFLGTFAKAYRDPDKAAGLWDELISKHGMARAGQMIRDNPLLLGRLHGHRTLNPNKVASAFKRTKRERFKLGEFKDVRFFENNDRRKEAIREARKLTREYEKFRKSQDILQDIRAKIDRARADVERSKRELDGLHEKGLTRKGLEETLKALFVRRAKALGRVTRKAIRQSDLTDERKEQLERVRNRYEERKRERTRQRERGRAFDLDLDLFDD
tara:strand:+ start:1953 stop:3791 length:1839 start_codon:yes stop_codon:yes gene_type:complete